MGKCNAVYQLSAVALAIAVLAGFAGPADATTFVADVSAPPTYAPDRNGHLSAFASATFPDVVLHVGDDLLLTVEFGSPLEVPQLDLASSHYALNLDRGAANGSARFNYPWFVNVGNGDTRFTVDARAYQNYGPPNTTSTFDVNSISYSFNAAPEPAIWTMMLLGLGWIGAGLRSRRCKTAVLGRSLSA